MIRRWGEGERTTEEKKRTKHVRYAPVSTRRYHSVIIDRTLFDDYVVRDHGDGRRWRTRAVCLPNSPLSVGDGDTEDGTRRIRSRLTAHGHGSRYGTLAGGFAVHLSERLAGFVVHTYGAVLRSAVSR